MVKRGIVVGLALLATPLMASAQGATIEGDVYLLMKSGDTKRGSGRIVQLVPLAGEFAEAKAKLCTAMTSRIDYLLGPYADSVNTEIAAAQKKRDRIAVLSFEGKRDVLLRQLNDSARTLLLDLMQKHATGTTGSGMNAHFVFSGVQPGRYAIYSEWTISDNEYAWWAPVSVLQGARLVRDLDNSVEISAIGGLPTAACTTP